MPSPNATFEVQSPNTSSGAPTTNTGANPVETVTAESLGWQLRASLPPLRLHSVSLYDEQANVLWLSEGALGPDEHSVVLEAIASLETDGSRPWHENGLGDGRMAIFLAVRAPQGALVGVVMVLADAKSVTEGLTERIITPHVRTLLQKLAVFLRPISVRATHTGKTLPKLELQLELGAEPMSPYGHGAREADRDYAPLASGDSMIVPTLAPPASSMSARAANPQPATAPVVTASDAAPSASTAATMTTRTMSARTMTERTVANPTMTARTMTERTVTNPTMTARTMTAPPMPAPTMTARTMTGATMAEAAATTTSRVLTLPEGATLVLEVQPYVKLRPGGLNRRYEVHARTVHRELHRAPEALDSLIIQQLLSWLGTHRGAWNSAQTSFTLNLSITTLEDERFPQFVASHLKTQGIASDNLGFEISEPLCVQRRAQVERFVTRCDQLGCFVIIDDFSWDSSVVPLLRSKALRMVKIDSRLTTVALKDKLAQATVVAIAQAAKVLGIHCAAKRVESQAALQWLTAIGCDFAQGALVSALQPLERLSTPSDAPTVLPAIKAADARGE